MIQRRLTNSPPLQGGVGGGSHAAESPITVPSLPAGERPVEGDESPLKDAAVATLFSAKGVERSLRDYDHSADDLINSNHDTFVGNLQRFLFVLRDNPVLNSVLAEGLPDVDFCTWYAQAKTTVGGMVGSGTLTWPIEKSQRLALQRALLETIAEGNESVPDFCINFMYTDNHYDSMVAEFNRQIVEPFTRDVRVLVEDVVDDVSSGSANGPESMLEAPKSIAFVMMSISSEIPDLEDVLNSIKRACDAHAIEAVRVDQIEHSGRITDVILKHLRTSQVLICDITHERPNVYYELGYAHGFGKEVILVAARGTKLHFDIKDYNVIFYRNHTELEDKVASRLGAVLSSF